MNALSTKIEAVSEHNTVEQDRKTCPLCGSSGWDTFFEMLDVPIFCNVLWPSRQAALNCDRGNIRLSFCDRCGFIGNSEFNPELLKYTEAYENSLYFSPRFQSYARALASDLIDTHNLHRKNIIEIGCGKGDFLISLCEMGDNFGVGFDPTYIPRPEHQRHGDRVQFIRDLYSEKYSDFHADFIICRHTLEHIQNPNILLKSLREALSDRSESTFFFEVPNSLDIFCNMAVWDIIYEHCCYFARPSLVYAFARNGFRVKKIQEAFNGQFLCLEARPVAKTGLSIGWHDKSLLLALKQELVQFATKFKAKLQTWKSCVSQMTSRGQRAVVWGAGSKGVTFLNLLQDRSLIDYVVDINPRKKDKYIAGTGQKIVSPDFLRHYLPSTIIIMNPIYENEIRQMTLMLGLRPEFICV